ncbi:unnamed protein product [Rotaria sordida]|uniref:Uncharacterized protein n=1 Tax=Rotaria sordida TaxID=392033 RepID=A0A814PUZ9_9BILA|nr:unnamed protein product [Rotaria sordida]CAF1368543.1 unnamed protein product [Rotaria sordida]CAF3647865.1 unnamed protein product [Rotaria sordida]
MKLIIIIVILLLGCVALNEALQCYSHDLCSINCPQLSYTIKSCTDNDNRCYTATFLGGIARGCAKERCNVQINANSVTANVCCETDLCNSATTSKLTLSILFMILGALILPRI